MPKMDYSALRVQKMKHNGKVRSLENNLEVEEKIKEHIDVLYETYAAHSFVSSMRQFITKHKFKFDNQEKDAEVLKEDKHQIIFSCETNYGRVDITKSVKRMASGNGLATDALHRIGLLEEMDTNCKFYVKHQLKIFNNAIALDEEVREEEKQLLHFLQTTIDDCTFENEHLSKEETSIVKLMAARLSVAKTIYEQKQKYVHVYNKLRQLLTKECMHGTFPLTYCYRNVLFAWDSILMGMPYPKKVYEFIIAYDIKNNTTKINDFKQAIMDICAETKQYQLTALFDDIDYTIDDEE